VDIRRNDAAQGRLLMWGEEEEESDCDTASTGSSSSMNEWGGRKRQFASPLECNAAGRTLLHQAAAQGSLAAMAQLLTARPTSAHDPLDGALLLARDGAGLTPLQAAAKAGQREAARLLLVKERELRQRMERAAERQAQAAQRRQQEEERQRQLELEEANSLLQRLPTSRRRFNYKSWAELQVKRSSAACVDALSHA